MGCKTTTFISLCFKKSIISIGLIVNVMLWTNENRRLFSTLDNRDNLVCIKSQVWCCPNHFPRRLSGSFHLPTSVRRIIGVTFILLFLSGLPLVYHKYFLQIFSHYLCPSLTGKMKHVIFLLYEYVKQLFSAMGEVMERLKWLMSSDKVAYIKLENSRFCPSHLIHRRQSQAWAPASWWCWQCLLCRGSGCGGAGWGSTAQGWGAAHRPGDHCAKALAYQVLGVANDSMHVCLGTLLHLDWHHWVMTKEDNGNITLLDKLWILISSITGSTRGNQGKEFQMLSPQKTIKKSVN